MNRGAWGYARVSTLKQGELGISLDCQKKNIEDYCSRSGLVLAGVLVDSGLSGGRADNRPALQKALANVCREKSALIFYSISRLARSLPDAAAIAKRIENAGASMVSISENFDSSTPSGRLIFGVLASVCAWQMEITQETVKANLGYLRTKDRRISRFAPYGYSLIPDASEKSGFSKQLLPCPAEQENLKLIRAMHAEGFSMSAIAESLNAKGIKPKRAKAWSKSGVHSVLHREVAK